MSETSVGFRRSFQAFIGHRHFVVACLLLSVVLRLAWIWLVDAKQVSDYHYYEEFAKNIATGHGYSLNGVPTGYWPVGYPGFLGALFYIFGASVLVGKLANIVLYAGTIYLTYELSRRIFQSESAARITVCILAFYPNHIAYTALLSSEILFAFLVVSGTILIHRARERFGWLLLCGLWWGLATLTKPQAVLLPLIVLLIFSASVRSFLKSGIVIYAALTLVVVPWMIRNSHVMGAPTLANTGGINLMIGNNPYAAGVHTFSAGMNDLLGDLKTTPLEFMFDGKEAARDARAKNVAMEYIIHNPGRIIALLPKKLLGLFQSDTEGFYYSLGMMDRPGGQSRKEVLAARAVAELYYLAILLLFLIALPTVIRNKIRGQYIGIAIIICFMIVYMVFFGNARYHFPLMPWFVIYAGIGAQLLLFGRKTLSETRELKVPALVKE